MRDSIEFIVRSSYIAEVMFAMLVLCVVGLKYAQDYGTYVNTNSTTAQKPLDLMLGVQNISIKTDEH